MSIKRKPIYIRTIVEYIFVFITLLQNNSVIYRQSGRNNKIITIIWFLLLVVLFVKSIYDLNINNTNVFPLVKFVGSSIIVMTLILVIEYVYYPYGVKYILMYILIPVCMITFFYNNFFNYQNSNLLLKYVNLVSIFAVISLFFWIASLVGISTNVSTTIDWGSIHTIPGYFHLHYIAQGSTDFIGMNLIRNTGIFTEAPMYAYVLSIAFLLNLFFNEDSKYFKIKFIILFITIFSTTSTTGLVTVFLSISFYIVFVKRNDTILKPIIGFAFVIVLLLSIRYIIQNKMNNSVWYSSSGLRINDIFSSFMAWKNHPIVGNGIDNSDSIVNFMNFNRVINNMSGLSSGAMVVLAYGGILLSLFYLIPTILGISVSKRMAGISILSFILYIVTIVNNSYMYIVLLSYFCCSYIVKRFDKDIKKRKLH